MQNLSCVLHASEPRPSGPLDIVRHIGAAARSSPRGFANASPAQDAGLKADAKRGLARRSVGWRTGGVSSGPPGAVPRRAERVNGFAFSPFALVTFIWGRK